MAKLKVEIEVDTNEAKILGKPWTTEQIVKSIHTTLAESVGYYPMFNANTIKVREIH